MFKLPPQIKQLTLLFFLLLVSQPVVYAQATKIDSLRSDLLKATHDTVRINCLLALATELYLSKPDTTEILISKAEELCNKLLLPGGANNPAIVAKKGMALRIRGLLYYYAGSYDQANVKLNEALRYSRLCNDKRNEARVFSNLGTVCLDLSDNDKALSNFFEAVKLATAVGDKPLIAGIYNNISIAYKNKSDYANALDYVSKGLKIDIETGNKPGIAFKLSSLGSLYHIQANFSKALDYYFQALKIDEEIGNKRGIARKLGNIGIIFQQQSDLPKALEYYKKALDMEKSIGNKTGIIAVTGNMGIVYHEMKDYSSALKYYYQARALAEEIGDKKAIIINLGHAGSAFKEMSDVTKDSAEIFRRRALDYYLQALPIAKEINGEHHIAVIYGNLATLYTRKKEYSLAEKYLVEAIKISEKIGAPDLLRDQHDFFCQLELDRRNFEGAYFHYREYVRLRDSISNTENSKKIIQSQLQYDFDKKEAVAKVEQEKRESLAREELKIQRQQRNGFILGFALMLGLAGVSYRSYRNKQKANKVISRQKEIVEQQKHLVEEKNQEILDSINYAKRLQEAILPPMRLVNEKLKDVFVLYKPKDIVAGDFYWLEEKNGVVLFAAADCTGHGVPGAMVSVVCANALNRSVKEFGITDPGKILDKVRELVIETFERSESEVKDGMDISLLALNSNGDSKELRWAGANNPLWIVKKGMSEIQELKGEKQPIGKYSDEKPFTTHFINIDKGDTIYLFTDGYSDQFGGENGKKFKSTNLKKLILSIQKEEMNVQKQLVDKTFETWKGSLEQVDDVSVVGIRL